MLSIFHISLSILRFIPVLQPAGLDLNSGKQDTAVDRTDGATEEQRVDGRDAPSEDLDAQPRLVARESDRRWVLCEESRCCSARVARGDAFARNPAARYCCNRRRYGSGRGGVLRAP